MFAWLKFLLKTTWPLAVNLVLLLQFAECSLRTIDHVQIDSGRRKFHLRLWMTRISSTLVLANVFQGYLGLEVSLFRPLPRDGATRDQTAIMVPERKQCNKSYGAENHHVGWLAPTFPELMKIEFQEREQKASFLTLFDAPVLQSKKTIRLTK
jgi:hypothetical protein